MTPSANPFFAPRAGPAWEFRKLDMTRASALILCTKDGRALLQHRTADAPRYPDHWALFGGKAEGDESAFECLTRELGEELGIDPRPAELIGRVTDPLGPLDVSVFCALNRWKIGELLAGQREGDFCGFFTFDEAATLKMPEHCRCALDMARGKGWVR